MKLLVLGVVLSAAAFMVACGGGEDKDAAPSAGTYTVVSGDNLFIIAKKHCVPDSSVSAWVEDLLDINNGEASSLTIGEVLDLPPGSPALCTTPGATATPQP